MLIHRHLRLLIGVGDFESGLVLPRQGLLFRAGFHLLRRAFHSNFCANRLEVRVQVAAPCVGFSLVQACRRKLLHIARLGVLLRDRAAIVGPLIMTCLVKSVEVRQIRHGLLKYAWRIFLHAVLRTKWRQLFVVNIELLDHDCVAHVGDSNQVLLVFIPQDLQVAQ